MIRISLYRRTHRRRNRFQSVGVVPLAVLVSNCVWLGRKPCLSPFAVTATTCVSQSSLAHLCRLACGMTFSSLDHIPLLAPVGIVYVLVVLGVRVLGVYIFSLLW
jgi:hypothetical protein